MVLHSLQTDLDISLGNFIRALCAIFLAFSTHNLARSGLEPATFLECSQRIAILALASFRSRFFGFLRFPIGHDLSLTSSHIA